VNVAINYRKNEAAAKDTLAKVKQRGSDGFIVQADVCRPDDITRMFARVKNRVREARHLRQQRATRRVRVLPGAHDHHSGAMGHGHEFPGEGVPVGVRRRAP